MSNPSFETIQTLEPKISKRRPPSWLKQLIEEQTALIFRIQDRSREFQFDKGKNVRNVEHYGWIVLWAKARSVLAELSLRSPFPVAGNIGSARGDLPLCGSAGGPIETSGLLPLLPDIASGGALSPHAAADLVPQPPDIESEGAFPPDAAADFVPPADIESGVAFPPGVAASWPIETSGGATPPLDIESGLGLPLGVPRDRPGETSGGATPPLNIESGVVLPLGVPRDRPGETLDLVLPQQPQQPYPPQQPQPPQQPPQPLQQPPQQPQPPPQQPPHPPLQQQLQPPQQQPQPPQQPDPQPPQPPQGGGGARNGRLTMILAFTGTLAGVLQYVVAWKGYVKEHKEGLFSLEDAFPLVFILFCVMVFIVLMRSLH